MGCLRPAWVEILRRFASQNDGIFEVPPAFCISGVSGVSEERRSQPV
jgi:hypothetical protein